MHRPIWFVSALTFALVAAPALAQAQDHREPPPPPHQDMHGQPAPPPPGHRETPDEARQRGEREKQLAATDAERDRTRAERQRQSQEAALGQLHGVRPGPDLNAEMSRYAERKATLARIREVAITQNRLDAQKRADDLLAKEEARHAAWIAAHRG